MPLIFNQKKMFSFENTLEKYRKNICSRGAKVFLFFLPCFSFSQDFYEDVSASLFRDLEIVEKVNREIHDKLPLIVNYQLQGGYFNMPSARTYEAGVLGLGFSYIPPYHLWGVSFQFFDHIETSGNYWVYKGVTEANFGHLGFGDDADRAANFKIILLRKEDGFPFLPDFALGWNDFLGSKRFRSFYVTATKEFLKYNFEATLGWGQGRIQGFYGGVAWTPFRRSKYFWKNLSLIAEYDANNYRRHQAEHPSGRTVKSRINAGLQLTLWDLLRLSGSTLRGDDWAGSIALDYNLGKTEGLFPKIYNRPAYAAPVDLEPIGILRSREEFSQEIAFAFKEQGFNLCSLYLIPKEKGKDHLWIKLINLRYREEEDVRSRIEYILGALVPENVTYLTVVIEADGVSIQEYQFRAEDLRRYAEKKIGENEFRIIAPLKEASSPPDEYEAALLFNRKKPSWVLTFRPWARTFFGSSKGKFKYEVGFSLGTEGYLLNQFFYCLNGSYTAKSSTDDLSDRDFLNPSRIINVRTDTIRYNQSSSFHLDQAYLQRSWNFGKGWFSRLAAGYFEIAYAGFAAEALYYPVYSNWAIGFEAATVWKRSYFGVGFQEKVRKMTNEGDQFFPFTGFQYFVDFYYQYKPFYLDFKVSAGQFLARDKGIRLQVSRSFASGLNFGIWYTFTNANDQVNNSRYYDKGFFFSMPLDIFLNKTSRTRIGYAMSAWLRDCGAKAATGKELYPTLYWERYNTNSFVTASD